MIDIHTHILPYIDDGSDDLEKSLKMIEEEILVGVKDVIITPHALRMNINRYKKEELIEAFTIFKNQVREKFEINLFLGQEITYHPQLIAYLKNNELLSMNNSKYILLELPFGEPIDDIDELVFSCKVLGYKIIIAHVERYDYYKYDDLLTLKSYGLLFQVNSNSVTGFSGKKYQKLVFKLFKDKLVDFVASDIHMFRKNDMDEAKNIIRKKFGEKTAELVFYENQKQLLRIK